MRVAAYQAPFAACSSIDVALNLIRAQVNVCAAEGVEILCCPEGILGGLADYVKCPTDMAIDVEGGQLEAVLAPLASPTVTTVLGFTEIDRRGRLYNSAAVYQRGAVVGICRKLYPAIHQSVYEAGDEMPVFKIGDLTFGIVICNDSNYYEPARIMAAQGAAALFVPTSNGLPSERFGPELVTMARNVDIARAIENSVAVVRADVAGRNRDLVSYGSTEIVDADGMGLASARPLEADLIVADIRTTPRRSRRGWDGARNPAVADAYARLVAERRASGQASA